ncbi:MAG: ComEC/Rec2 family competence protein [Oscillospiraceae bacterium]|nr:ComEC/Rec2 family competence protein [Candidatus Equicaccousia limihippi]
MFILLSLVCISGAVRLLFYLPCAQSLNGETAAITGYVCDAGISEKEYTAYEINVTSVTTENESHYIPPYFKIKIYDDEGLSFSSFKDITFTARLNAIDDFYKSSSYSDGVYMTASLIKVNAVNEPTGFHVEKVTYDISTAVKSVLNKYLYYDNAALSSAIMLGDTSQLSDDFYLNVRASGVSHMLVVSGMHLTIVTMLFLKFFNKIKIPYYTKYAILLVLALFVMTLCGFGKSVMRAGITLIIYLIGKILFEESEPLVSLGASTVLLVIINPFLFGSIGYLLSFTSTFGIIYLTPKFLAVLSKVKLKGGLRKVYIVICEILAQTLGALFVSLPVLMFYFSSVSVVAPLTNLILCYPVTVVLCILVIASLLSFIPLLSYFCPPLFIIASYLLKFIRFIIDKLGSLEYAVMPTKDEFYIVWVILAFAFAVLIILRRFKDYKSARIISALSAIGAATVSAVLVANALFSSPVYTDVAIVKCRYGASLIILRGKDVVIIDAGESEKTAFNITSALQNFGKRYADDLLLPYDSSGLVGGYYLNDKINLKRITVNGYGKEPQDIYDTFSEENTEIFFDNASGNVGDIYYRIDGETAMITAKNRKIVVTADKDYVSKGEEILVSYGFIPQDGISAYTYVSGNNLNAEEIPDGYTQLTHTCQIRLTD